MPAQTRHMFHGSPLHSVKPEVFFLHLIIEAFLLGGHTCGGQRANCGSRFVPRTMEVLEIKLRAPRIAKGLLPAWPP